MSRKLIVDLSEEEYARLTAYSVTHKCSKGTVTRKALNRLFNSKRQGVLGLGRYRAEHRKPAEGRSSGDL